MIGTWSLFACSSSCWIAAARKVSAAARQGLRLFCFSRWATFAIVVVFPEPLIPANRITKGCFISNDSLIPARKFGGLISMDSMDSLSSFERSTSFGVCPISFSASDSFMDSTALYATLFCNNIISSSLKSSLNFSSVSLFLNFVKNPFSSVGVLIVFLSDSSSSSFGFFAFLIFGSFIFISFPFSLTLIFLVDFSMVFSLFFFIHFLSFVFNELNIF